MGRKERCDVLARATQCKNSRAYSEGFVLNAPADLPDGQYVATFDGYMLRATKDRGLWFTSADLARNAA